MVIGLIALAPIAVGSVHTSTRSLVFSLAILALLATLLDRRAKGRPFPITMPLVALAIAFVATALQLVPIPEAVMGAISPAAHDILRTTLGAYGHHPLSLDPSATISELSKIGAYAAFFAAAVVYSSRAHRRRRIVIAVAATSTAVALIGFVQAAAGSTKILFFYQPHAQILNELLVRGTFVNPNHFGALMVLGAPCALVLGLREQRLRVPAFIAVIVINVGVVLSLSRAAIIAAPLAQAVAFGVDRWQLRHGSRQRAPWEARAALVIAIIGAVAVAGVFAAGRLAPALASTELANPLSDPRSKFHAWGEASTLVWKYPWTGTGRGAFEFAFTQVTERGGDVHYKFIENGYLQAVTDWGVPVAALLIVIAGWALVIAMRGLRDDPFAVGTLGAVVGLAVHEAADFSVELPGVALPALALLATLFARNNADSEPGRRRIRVALSHIAAPALLAAVVAIAAVRPSAEADAAEVNRLARDGSVPTAEFLAHAERVRWQHPADYFLHALVGRRLAAEMHPATIDWLNDAMYLNPTHPGPHLVAAEVLARAGRQPQALLEYRTAASLLMDPSPVWDRVVMRFSDVADLLAATPDEAGHLARLGAWLMTHERRKDAERVYAVALERDPRNLAALHQLTQLALDRGDAAAARARATVLRQIDASADAGRKAARAEILGGDLEAAARILDEVRDRGPAMLLVELELADAFSRKGDAPRARARLDRLNWNMDRASLIRLHETRAEIERRAGNEHQYRWELEQAARLR